MGRWDQIVGEEVASHCRPETFQDQMLTVRTDSAAWATQVRLLAPSVLARLAEELGAGVVTRLVVKGPAGPSWKRGHRTVQGGRGPRDTSADAASAPSAPTRRRALQRPVGTGRRGGSRPHPIQWRKTGTEGPQDACPRRPEA